MTLRLREVSDEERVAVQRMARSHTLGAGMVRRAQIIVHAMGGLKAEEIATRMDLCANTVRHWLNRFNARGLKGLEEDVRTGRPPTYTAEPRSAVITAALTRPTELGLPFASWTLDRLVTYLSSQGIGMRRSRISEILRAGRSRLRQKKGVIEQLYTAPPVGSVVVCLDEMGPQAAKSYPGQQLVTPAAPTAGRAKQEIDYGRRGAGYVFGAFQPASGEAFTQPYERRTAANWVDFLSDVEAWIDPAVERV